MVGAIGTTPYLSNPYLAGLGYYGTGLDSSSYMLENPYQSFSMMGGYSPSFGASPYSTGMIGMNGMTNPITFMAQMQMAQQAANQSIEASQLQHASNMHNLLLDTQLNAKQRGNDNKIETLLVKGGIDSDVKLLVEAVRKGEANKICIAYDSLKNQIVREHADKINRLPQKDAEKYVRQIINEEYTAYTQAIDGVPTDLDSDIIRFGETAFMHGFNKTFHGKDYHDKYTEEVLAYINDRPIDNKAGKDRMEKIGGYAERVVEGAASVPVGYIGGGLAAAGLAGLAKIVSFGKIPFGKFFGGIAKPLACIGAIGALVGDIMWQNSRA